MAGAYWGSRIRDDSACRYTLDSLEAIFPGGFAEDLAFPLGMWMAGQDMLGYENCRKVRDCAQALSMVYYERGWSELLGAHMVGAEVTEMIQGYTIGKTLETTEAELMQTVFPHPTISESMHESVLAAYGKALHI